MATLSLDFLRNYRLGTYRESEPVAYQYDQGHVLDILVPGAVASAEVQYWTRGMTEAAAYEVGSITQQTDSSYVIECNVPNEFFDTWGDLRVYLVVTDDSKYVVTYEGRIKVLQREKPEDYVDDDPDNEALRVLTEAREAAQSASADADRAAQVAASIPADYSELSGDVSDLTGEVGQLNERFSDITEYTSNRFDTSKITANQYITQDGTVTASQNFSVTDYIPVSEGEVLYFRSRRTDNAFYSFDARFLCAYDANKTAVSASGGAFVGGTYTVPAGIAFIRLSISNTYLTNWSDFYIGTVNVTQDTYVPFDVQLKIPSDITNRIDENTANIATNTSGILSLEGEINGFDDAITSIFSGTDYVEKTYVNMEQGAIVAGNESDSTTDIRSGYIVNDDLTFNYDNTIYKIDVIRYDSNKSYVGHTGYVTISPLKLSNYSIADPFVRIILARQDGADLSPANLVYTAKTIANNIAYTDSTAYTVASGGSILQGLKHCYDNGIRKLIVEAGTYDVIADYQSVYGADYFDNYAGYATSDPFDRGLWLENIEIVFSAGAKVVCKYTGNNTSVSQNFSAFATGNNVIIDGLVLDAENLRYGIHADYNSGANQTYFTVKNSDLRHYKREDSIQAIGAGLGRHVLWIFENTIFRSDVNHICMRIHNNVSADAQSKIIVKNCYIDGDGYFKFNAYSTSELQTIIEVCGCSYKTAPVVGKETTQSNENFTMIAWNNELRA